MPEYKPPFLIDRHSLGSKKPTPNRGCHRQVDTVMFPAQARKRLRGSLSACRSVGAFACCRVWKTRGTSANQSRTWLGRQSETASPFCRTQPGGAGVKLTDAGHIKIARPHARGRPLAVDVSIPMAGWTLSGWDSMNFRSGAAQSLEHGFRGRPRVFSGLHRLAAAGWASPLGQPPLFCLSLYI